MLEFQYVRSRHLPECLWKVVRGTSIGLLHSGEFTDWTFYVLVEKPLFETGLLDELNVVAWWRYKDDVLILSRGQCDTSKLLANMSSGDKPWLFKVEVENVRSLHYLDTWTCA